MTFERLGPQHAFLEASLGGNAWLVFGRRTIADAYLYMLARTADLMPEGLTPCPMLSAFRARLELDPGVVAALAEQDSVPAGRTRTDVGRCRDSALVPQGLRGLTLPGRSERTGKTDAARRRRILRSFRRLLALRNHRSARKRGVGGSAASKLTRKPA